MTEEIKITWEQARRLFSSEIEAERDAAIARAERAENDARLECGAHSLTADKAIAALARAERLEGELKQVEAVRKAERFAAEILQSELDALRSKR